MTTEPARTVAAVTAPCPHQRPSRAACPHCLGINGPPAARAQDAPVTEVFVRIRRVDGTQQEITASFPEPFLLRIGARPEEAGLPAGMADPGRKEPLVAVLFGGNPDAGGIQVSQAGISMYEDS